LDSADSVTRADLIEGRDATETRDVEAVLEAFTAERLLTLTADTVELSHEVLLTAWPLLRDTWLADTHADRVVRTRLHTTAAEWARNSRDPSYLYTGSLLQAATETVARIRADPLRHAPPTQAERDFLHASDRAQRRITRRRQGLTALLSALVIALALVAALAIRTAGVAVRNAASAARQHAIALSRQLAAESLSIDAADPVTSRRLAVAAWHVFPTSQAGSVMTTLLTEQQQNGILPADPSAVEGVAFSPHGEFLASADADADGTVRLWNTATGQPAGAPIHATSGRGGVAEVAFSPHGDLLASADADGTVRLWNLATSRPVGTSLHAASAGAKFGVPLSPDGRLTAGGGIVFGVAFSPDGKLLASVGVSGTVRLWNPKTGHPVGAPLYATSAQPGGIGVGGVTFSPDSRLLASDGAGGEVRLWNVVTGRPVRPSMPP